MTTAILCAHPNLRGTTATSPYNHVRIHLVDSDPAKQPKGIAAPDTTGAHESP
jgi:hypothetical protein